MYVKYLTWQASCMLRRSSSLPNPSRENRRTKRGNFRGVPIRVKRRHTSRNRSSSVCSPYAESELKLGPGARSASLATALSLRSCSEPSRKDRTSEISSSARSSMFRGRSMIFAQQGQPRVGLRRSLATAWNSRLTKGGEGPGEVTPRSSWASEGKSEELRGYLKDRNLKQRVPGKISKDARTSDASLNREQNVFFFLIKNSKRKKKVSGTKVIHPPRTHQ